MTLTLDALNRMSPGDFASAVGDTFELAPWVAGSAAARRPFQTVTALHEAMMGAVRAAPRERQVEFLHGHPDLAEHQSIAAELGSFIKKKMNW